MENKQHGSVSQLAKCYSVVPSQAVCVYTACIRERREAEIHASLKSSTEVSAGRFGI